MFSSTLEQLHPFGMPRPMSGGGGGHRPWKPNVEVAPNCPRCESSNTKFCYYNNYSLTQPRYFCKGCRRYWTKGGSLRNVPVGGGCRKNRRGKSSSAARVLSSSSGLRATTTSTDSYGRDLAPPSGCSAALRPDLALDGMVGGRSSHQPMVSPPPDHDQDASGTIDLAALYSKFLNHSCPEYAESQGGREGQFDVPEPADGYDLGGGSSEGEMGMMGELMSNYPFDVDVVDVTSGGYESCSLGMPESMSAAEVVLFPGLSSSWQAPELQPGLCPFPGMGTCSDWSSLDQSSFGAF